MIQEIDEITFWEEIKSLSKKGVTFFVGAGVSSIYPCNLPTFNKLISDLIEGYIPYLSDMGMVKHDDIVMDHEMLIGFQNECKNFSYISPDYCLMLLSIANKNLIIDYISSLFATKAFNKVHSAIIHLLLSNPTNTLISCNFDTCFESCIEKYGVNNQIKTTIGSPPLNKLFDDLNFIKIHGCAKNPNTIIATLTDEYCQHTGWLNFTEIKITILSSWLSLMEKIIERPIVFLGYSGNDNFFRYLINLKGKKEFYWLLYKYGSKREKDVLFEYESDENTMIKISFGDLSNVSSFFQIEFMEFRDDKEPFKNKFRDFLPKGQDPSVLLSFFNLLSLLLPNTAFRLFKENEVLLNKYFSNNYILVDIASFVYSSKGDRIACLQNYLRGLDIAERSNDRTRKYLYSTYAGICYVDMGDYSEASKKLKFVFDNYGDVDMSQTIVALNDFHMGELYAAANEFKLAQKFYEESLKLCELEGLIKNQAYVYNSLGNLYRLQLNIDKAIEYFNKSIDIKRRLGDKRTLANTLNNLSSIYLYDLGDKERERGIRLLEESIKIKEKIEDKAGLCSAYTNYGIFLLHENKTDEAEHYLEKSYKLKQEIGDLLRLDSSLVWLGIAKIKKGYYHDGACYLMKGLKHAENKKKYVRIFAYIQAYEKIVGEIYNSELKDLDDLIKKYKATFSGSSSSNTA